RGAAGRRDGRYRAESGRDGAPGDLDPAYPRRGDDREPCPGDVPARGAGDRALAAGRGAPGRGLAAAVTARRRPRARGGRGDPDLHCGRARHHPGREPHARAAQLHPRRPRAVRDADLGPAPAGPGRGRGHHVRDGPRRRDAIGRLRAPDADAATPLARDRAGGGGSVERAPQAVSGRPFAGVLAPITTPFDGATGAVAPVHLRQNVVRLLDAGLDGVVVAGSTGESALLDPDEQRRMIGWVREVLPDGRWLVAGTGAESTRQAVARPGGFGIAPLLGARARLRRGHPGSGVLRGSPLRRPRRRVPRRGSGPRRGAAGVAGAARQGDRREARPRRGEGRDGRRGRGAVRRPRAGAARAAGPGRAGAGGEPRLRVTDARALLEEISVSRLVGTRRHAAVREILKRELAARGFVVMEQQFLARPQLPLWGRAPADAVNLIAVRPRARITTWLV